MPVLNRRYDNIKVYRPKGTRTALGEERRDWAKSTALLLHSLPYSVEEAIKKAFSAFHEEHGRYPVQDNLIVELLINPDVIRASVIEIPELANEVT